MNRIYNSMMQCGQLVTTCSKYYNKKLEKHKWKQEINSFFSFFNSTIYTQSIAADCDSYFVTTYIKIHSIWKWKEKKIKENSNQKKLIVDRLSNAFSEEESIIVKLKKESKMHNWVSSQVPIIVVSSTLIKNVTSWFNRIDAT